MPTLSPRRARARARARGFKGAPYPWEADPETGSEQIPHFAYVLSEREIHVNADIAIAQWQYWLATEPDRDWLKQYGWPVIRNLADFWASRASWNADKRRYEIVHVTSVAESYNDVPNDTFTNVSAQKVLDVAAKAAAIVGARADPHWAEVGAKLYIPFSETEQRHLDFDASMPRDPLEGSTLDLLMYPSLDLPMTAQILRNDFDYTMVCPHNVLEGGADRFTPCTPEMPRRAMRTDPGGSARTRAPHSPDNSDLQWPRQWHDS